MSITLEAGAFARDEPAPLDVSVLIVDPTGRTVGSARQTSTLGGGPASATSAPDVNVRTHVELDPGDYELRVSVAAQKTEAAGSVFTYVRVPKFATARLSMSDVAIEVGATADAAMQPAAPVSTRPTTRRAFARDDRVRAFLQLYQGTGRTDAIVPASVRARILDARGAVAYDRALVFAAGDFRARRADCRIDVPVDRLAAGQYLLEIEATAGGERETRKLRFSVQQRGRRLHDAAQTLFPHSSTMIATTRPSRDWRIVK